MAFENIQIAYGNVTLDTSGSSFFTLDHDNQRLTEKNSSGTVIFNYLLDASIIEVQSLQHDGYYFWSLEKQGTSGFRVRKWEIGADNLVRVINELSYISGAIDKYNVNAMAVESYGDSLDNAESPGTTSFDVVDGGTVSVGDRITVGPSTAVGYEGLISSVIVTGKPTSTTLEVAPALDRGFSPADPVYFTRSFFVFSDTAPANLTGALYKFRHYDGFPLALNVSNLFGAVRASTFFSGKLLFVKGGEVIWLNPGSQNIFKSQAIENLDQLRGEYLTAYDLTSFSDTLYRLETKHVSFNGGSGEWETEDWAPLFNYNTSSTIPAVYFVAVKAEPPMLHRSAAGIPAAELKSLITVTVLDQFRTPVSSRTVDLTSDGGGLSSAQETTDVNGQVSVEYTADTSLGEVTITADVS